MTDNILTLPEPTMKRTPLRLIMLVCNCGCETYGLYADGSMRCAYCDTPVDPESEKTWREKMPELTDAEFEKMSEDDVKVHNIFYGSPKLARRRVMRDISHWVDREALALVIGYNIDGTGQSWANIETEEQREWVLRKIDSLREYIEQKSIDTIGHVIYTPVEAEDVETAGQKSTASETEANTVEGDTPATEGGTSGSGDASGG